MCLNLWSQTYRCARAGVAVVEARDGMRGFRARKGIGRMWVSKLRREVRRSALSLDLFNHKELRDKADRWDQGNRGWCRGRYSKKGVPLIVDTGK